MANTVETLINRGYEYKQQRAPVEAEACYEQALAICEQDLGPAHRLAAVAHNNLEHCENRSEMWKAPVAVTEQALPAWEAALRPEHLETAAGSGPSGYGTYAAALFGVRHAPLQRWRGVGSTAAFGAGN
ncbi:MAG TPA: tetratricopeptide repeat protein [Candidatus Binatia bacterium]|nr:tetratricopeptide repeat protein [Candidatus Binatia bacterium]